MFRELFINYNISGVKRACRAQPDQGEALKNKEKIASY